MKVMTVTHLRHPDVLSREDLTEIYLAALEAEAAAVSDRDGLVVDPSIGHIAPGIPRPPA